MRGSGRHGERRKNDRGGHGRLHVRGRSRVQLGVVMFVMFARLPGRDKARPLQSDKMGERRKQGGERPEDWRRCASPADWSAKRKSEHRP